MKKIIFACVGLIVCILAFGVFLYIQKSNLAEDVIAPVYTQDCFPRTLMQNGVTQKCFEGANFGNNEFCSESELKMIYEYYKKGQENDPLNDGSGNCCADEVN